MIFIVFLWQTNFSYRQSFENPLINLHIKIGIVFLCLIKTINCDCYYHLPFSTMTWLSNKAIQFTNNVTFDNDIRRVSMTN